MKVTLSDGSNVNLTETWECMDGCSDCHSEIVATDCETEKVLASWYGSLPDEEDEDFDLEEFSAEVERMINEYGL